MNAELQTEATESGEPTEQPSERDEKDKPMQRAMLAVRAFYSPGDSKYKSKSAAAKAYNVSRQFFRHMESELIRGHRSAQFHCKWRNTSSPRAGMLRVDECNS